MEATTKTIIDVNAPIVTKAGKHSPRPLIQMASIAAYNANDKNRPNGTIT